MRSCRCFDVAVDITALPATATQPAIPSMKTASPALPHQPSPSELAEMDSSKRKRARKACQPCHERKRKCDGGEPCTTCIEWDYECYYEDRPQKKSRAVGQPSPRSQTAKSPQQSTPGPSPAKSNHCGLVRRMEANSGAAFVRKLGLKIDPAKAPKLNLFGWNIGARQLSSSQPSAGPALSIFEITSWDHFKALAQVYFEKVDPCYGFIEQSHFFERLNARWQSSPVPEVYDGVICGIAAIGCLFSQRIATITELHLIRTAKACLEMHHLTGPPCLDLLTGWTLRSVYLRMTDSPHSTWMASSTLMHLIEASGLHPEKQYDSVLPPPLECDQHARPDIHRRRVGVAHHLNVWSSYDLGFLGCCFARDDLPLPPSPKLGDYTGEVLGLLPISVRMDPGKTKDETDLESTLSKLLEGSHTQPPSVMAQCNLVLCILRRIHTQNLDLSPKLAENTLALLKKALGCARSMVLDCSPWHQVANVPFQITCVLLVMDTRSSLEMLPEAMQTLNLVASTYNTETMREACSAAYLLVLLHQQRRRDDVAIFGEALNNHQQEQSVDFSQQFSPSTEEYNWLGH